MTPAIKVEGLVKQFGSFTALKSVSFEVEKNSVVGFLGPNGAGKTTTLRIIAGLSKSTVGSVYVNGINMVFGKQKSNTLIGYLPEQPAFYPWMNSTEYLMFIGGLGYDKKVDLRSKITQTLQLVGLLEARKRKIVGFSNGMKQRLGIAQALLNDPSILVFDEPVSALDPIGRRDILQLLHELKNNHTILFSSHILNDVERLCETVIVINKGEIVTQSRVTALKKEFSKPVVKVTFERAIEQHELEKISKLVGVKVLGNENESIELAITDEQILADNNLLTALVALNVPIRSFGYEQPELEDIFINLVSKKHE